MRNTLNSITVYISLSIGLISLVLFFVDLSRGDFTKAFGDFIVAALFLGHTWYVMEILSGRKLERQILKSAGKQEQKSERSEDSEKPESSEKPEEQKEPEEHEKQDVQHEFPEKIMRYLDIHQIDFSSGILCLPNGSNALQESHLSFWRFELESFYCLLVSRHEAILVSDSGKKRRVLSRRIERSVWLSLCDRIRSFPFEDWEQDGTRSDPMNENFNWLCYVKIEGEDLFAAEGRDQYPRNPTLNGSSAVVKESDASFECLVKLLRNLIENGAV